jgi:hypothetical protein
MGENCGGGDLGKREMERLSCKLKESEEKNKINDLSPCMLHVVTAHCPNLMEDADGALKFQGPLMGHPEISGAKEE